MKFVAILCGTLVISIAASAKLLMDYKDNRNAFEQPRYAQIEADRKGQKDWVKIVAIAPDDMFPFSSREQGSIFTDIFQNGFNYFHINMIFRYTNKSYERLVARFESGANLEEINARIGVYYEDMPFSRNQYIYPAYFDNKVHIITARGNILDIHKKEDLKQYKGVYAGEDKISKTVNNEFNTLGMYQAENFEKAFEYLLTGQADYMAATYYPSLLSAYKLGIKDYIAYSKQAVWNMPLFIRVNPKLKRHKSIATLENYLKSKEYKEVRDAEFNKLVEIYKEKTRGIVPPTYIKIEPEDDEETMQEIQQNEEKQNLEN